MVMHWFTRDLLNGVLSDEEHDRRFEQYRAHLANLLPELRSSVAELASTNLHDGVIIQWAVDCAQRRVSFRVIAGDLQRGYQFVTLIFDGATLVGTVPQQLGEWLPRAEIVYDELARGEQGYEYRLILAPDGEFGVRFQDVAISLEPAQPADYDRSLNP